MYVCGPTVYKPSHVGHMVGPVIFDTVKRYLTYCGYQVTFVVNITDVDDKLIKQAALEKTTVKELAERVTRDYVECLRRLGVTSIDQMPKVSETMPAILAMIEGLIEKGYAYAAAGDVYFDISRDDDYGKLCRRDPEQMEAGARIEPSPHKRNPGDFALWKAAKPGEPAWESPWGPGRPGWHIECSAMSRQLLGETLDIHGGGLDLQFPHHENELAQSESFNGKPFARYWMHNGLMRIRSQASKIKDGVPGGDEGGEVQKMSKSLGNEIVVGPLLERHHPETLRLLLLSSHYRSPIEYSEERLAELRRGLESFYRFFERYERVTGTSFYALTHEKTGAALAESGREFLCELHGHRTGFLGCMDDDFNTGGAIGVLYDLLTSLNRFADVNKLEEVKTGPAVEEFVIGAKLLRELSRILGLFLEPVRSPQANGADQALLDGLMTLLIDLRAESRKAKNFAVADQIRKRLAELGVTLEDRTGGTDWRRE
jgi:cysteinyl-tRNA synthetase